jgi:hypothetical protein
VRGQDTARRRPCRGRTRVRVRTWLELEDGDDPNRRAPPVSEGEEGEERAGRRWAVGPGKGRKSGAGWASHTGGRERKGERPAGLGRVEEKEKGRNKMGRAKRRKREKEKEMHSKAFEFKS